MLVALLVVAAIGWWLIAAARARARRHREALHILDETIRRHCRALTVRRRQLLVSDPYGNVQTGKWEKECAYFWSNNVLPLWSVKQRAQMIWMSPAAEIDRRLAAEGVDLDDLLPTFTDRDPIEYEHYCAELLRQSGWDARVTLASNDQGSDVIAERAGLKLILQCKLYRNAVGNKAVQEASAARAHEQADFAAVVASSTFTSAARSLAKTNDIALLHHEELQEWVEALIETPAVAQPG